MPHLFVSAQEWKRLIKRIQAMEEQMTDINADQTKLDADVASLDAGIANVEAEIAALKAVPAGTPLNFAGLDAAVAKLQSDGTAPPPPPA